MVSSSRSWNEPTADNQTGRSRARSHQRHPGNAALGLLPYRGGVFRLLGLSHRLRIHPEVTHISILHHIVFPFDTRETFRAATGFTAVV